MSEVISEYWGTPEEWQTSFFGIKYKVSPNSIWTQYTNYPDNNLQEFGEPLDTSPAFWGWKNDCSWATKHQRSIKSGVVQDVYCQPDNCSPVMGFDYKTSQYGTYSAYYRFNPRQRFNFDTVGNFGEHANYDEGKALTNLGTESASVPWTDMEWKSWCILPYVTIGKIVNNELVSKSMTLTDTDGDVKNLQDYLDEGYVPVKIDMSSMYYGDATGQTVRTVLTMYQSIIPMLVGMSDIKMTQDVYDWYSTNTESTIQSDWVYYIQPDYGHDLAIGQAPFTAYVTSAGTWQDITSPYYNPPEATYRGEQTLGMIVTATVGAYNSETLKAVNYKSCATVQEFDDVSYHWETVVYQSGQESADNVYTYTKLVIDNYDDTKWEDEAHAYYGAILHECAHFGLKFASSGNLAEYGNLTSSGNGIGLYIPVFTEQMHTTGLYKTGQDFITDENVDSDSARDFDFNPDVPVPDEPGEDVPGGKTGNWSYNKGDFTLPNNSQYYVLGNQTFADFSHWCKATYEKPGDENHVQHSNLEWNGVDCTDWVTTVKFYPFNIPKTNEVYPIKVGFIQAQRQDVQQGLVDITAPLYKYDTSDCTYKLGSFVLDANFLGKNFRGTALAKVWLKLPFYGDFELDLGRYFDTTVSIELIMDYITGTGCYMIYADTCLFDTIDVHIGMELPLTGYNMGTYQSNMKQLDEQLRQARWSRTVGVASNVATMIGGAVTGQYLAVGTAGANMVANLGSTGITEKATEYKLNHTSPTGGQCSSASAFCGLVQDLRVRVVTARPKCQDGYSAEHPDRKSSYAKTVGYACVKSGKLSSFTGLTVCSGYNASSITCTGAERELIASALNSGVIV